MLFVILLFCFFCFFKVEYHSINTVAQTSWLWSVIENMTQMRLATPAHYFGTTHTIAVISFVNNGAFADGFVKGRPAATAFKFRIAAKQCISAYRAVVRSYFVKIFVLAGIRA